MGNNDNKPNVKEMVKALCDIESGLTKWEVDFVENVSHLKPNQLTPKQISTIEKLYEEHC